MMALFTFTMPSQEHPHVNAPFAPFAAKAQTAVQGGVHHHYYTSHRQERDQPHSNLSAENIDHENRIGLLEHLVEELMEKVSALGDAQSVPNLVPSPVLTPVPSPTPSEGVEEAASEAAHNTDADAVQELVDVSCERVGLLDGGSKEQHAELNERKAKAQVKLHAKLRYPPDIFDDLDSGGA